MKDNELKRLTGAMFCSSLPCNPIPFARGLADLVSDNGTDAIRSSDAKRILWVLMAQAYGSIATVSLTDEWSALDAGSNHND